MPAYRGKDVVVLFNSVDISGDGRSVSYQESADTLDTSVYGDTRRTKIAGLEDGTGAFDALDTTGAWSALWDQIAVGTAATMEIRPEGTGSGLRSTSFTAIITARSLDLPYDDLAKFSLSYAMSGTPVEAEQA